MHHSEQPLSEELNRSLFKGINGQFGASGRFPEGKLTDADEGEICFGVAHDPASCKVVLNFGTPVAWVGMNPSQAVDLANALLEHARNARLLTRRKTRSLAADEHGFSDPGSDPEPRTLNPGA